MLIWGYEAIPTLESAPPIFSFPFNVSNLNPQPDISFIPKYARAFFTDHLIKTIISLLLTSLVKSIPSRSDIINVYEVYPVFLFTIILFPNGMYSPGICLKYLREMMSWGHWTWPLSREILFKPNYLWPGFTHSLHLILISFSTCGVRWGDSVKA